MRVCQYRVKRVLWRNGDRFTLEGEEYRGVFGLLSPEEASRYGVQDSEGTGLRRVWAIAVSSDSEVPRSGVVVRGSQTMSLLGVVERFWRERVIFRMLIVVE